MRWTGHVAHMGERTGIYRVLLGKLEGKRPLGRCGMWSYGLDQADSREGQVVGTCECSNECLRSIKCGEFLD